MNSIRDLTWEDLYSWAGKKTVSKGYSYQRGNLVLKTNEISDQIICGSVQGSELYYTVVSAKGHLASYCSCPVGINCKHGVALVLSYLEMIKKGKNVREPSQEDFVKHYKILISQESDGFDFQESDSDSVPFQMEGFLQTLSKDELISIILSALDGNHDLATILDRRQKIEQLPLDVSIAGILAEIEDITSQEVEYSGWYEMDNHDVPDYSGILESFTSLLNFGKCEEILRLGLLLLGKANGQLEMDDESGSISSQIEECMEIVAEALKNSDLPIHKRLLSAIKFLQTDEYELVCDISDFIGMEHPGEEWSLVADILMDKQPNSKSKDAGEPFQFQGDMTEWIEIALERSGRINEAICFSEEQAEKTNRYLPLIQLLIRAGQKKEAIKWIKKGVAKTSHESFGVISLLREMKRLFEQSEDWLMVAALVTEDFLREPNIKHYEQVMISTAKAGVLHDIRPLILSYLKQGTFPAMSKKGSVIQELSALDGKTILENM